MHQSHSKDAASTASVLSVYSPAEEPASVATFVVKSITCLSCTEIVQLNLGRNVRLFFLITSTGQTELAISNGNTRKITSYWVLLTNAGGEAPGSSGDNVSLCIYPTVYPEY